MITVDPMGVAASTAAVSISSSGLNIIVSGQSGYILMVLGAVLHASASVQYTFEDSTGAILGGPFDTAQQGGDVLPYSPAGWFFAPDGKDLCIYLNGAVALGGLVRYLKVKTSDYNYYRDTQQALGKG